MQGYKTVKGSQKKREKSKIEGLTFFPLPFSLFFCLLHVFQIRQLFRGMRVNIYA